MIDLTNVQHNPILEEMVDVLCNKTQNIDREFFRVEAAYFMAKMASSMRAQVSTKDRGNIPVNMYSLNLGTSGYGKGYSIHILEEQFIKAFRRRFMDHTFPTVAEENLLRIASRNAARNGTDIAEEETKMTKEFRSAGAYPFTFDSGTVPAVKQLRHKLLLAGTGSINLQIDEIGSNLISSIELLNIFLELYDQGLVKSKLVKSTQENTRFEEVEGKTPTNMLLFGTPSKLFDGAQTEDQFYSFLETGYARRCLFGIGKLQYKSYESQTPEEIFHDLTTEDNDETIKKLSRHFHDLADPAGYGWTMDMDDDVAIALLAYKIECEKHSETLGEHQEVEKAETNHRYFKALKLAGAYAFIDASSKVTMDHMLSAILLVEESGRSFKRILTREKPYVKLAKFLSETEQEVTHADLLESLPFYKSGIGARNEMMTLATAWGYKNHIVIQKTFLDGIEFFKGKTLEKTNLDEVIVSYSDHYAFDYLNEVVPFDELHTLMGANGMHWINHHVDKGHRAETNIQPGFNLIVLDIDENTSLSLAHKLLADYKFMTYTTKRHTEESNRFRIIIPINYTLELSSEDYKLFYKAFLDWLPFKSDPSVDQRAKKWETYSKGSHHYNDGDILDVLPFIPMTSRNEAHNEQVKQLQSLDNLERWFAQRISTGNRNNEMIKFALALVDSGLSLAEISAAVHGFNEKLSNPLDKGEIDSTVLQTAAKRFTNANPTQ